ncbi:hypothetical protein NQ317_017619 [Molorchus minor]|uniref:Uncharacterized protein n=1 Tax=Molorchus minor TaxID=1323400 RepID=A0ABQ9IT41_9CUCU|nr:hypothetical protein NQ317_017619 [Molorchus minor]
MGLYCVRYSEHRSLLELLNTTMWCSNVIIIHNVCKVLVVSNPRNRFVIVLGGFGKNIGLSPSYQNDFSVYQGERCFSV